MNGVNDMFSKREYAIFRKLSELAESIFTTQHIGNTYKTKLVPAIQKWQAIEGIMWVDLVRDKWEV